jgi:hypothetical protein
MRERSADVPMAQARVIAGETTQEAHVRDHRRSLPAPRRPR